MKTFIKHAGRALLVAPAMMLGMMFVAAPVAAQCPDTIDVSKGIGQGAECAKPDTAPADLFGENSVFVTVTNILLFIIGAIAVIMLIVGGIRYVVSQGDQNAITSAKNTILYAIIGIVVSFLAFAAVRFVTSQLKQGTDSAAIVRSLALK